jgi:hypothetical protein
MAEGLHDAAIARRGHEYHNCKALVRRECPPGPRGGPALFAGLAVIVKV